MLEDLGQQAIINLLSHLCFIAIAFYALQALHFDKLLRGNRVFQARILYVLLSIIIGSAVSNFFLDYLYWSQQLQLLF